MVEACKKAPEMWAISCKQSNPYGCICSSINEAPTWVAMPSSGFVHTLLLALAHVLSVALLALQVHGER